MYGFCYPPQTLTNGGGIRVLGVSEGYLHGGMGNNDMGLGQAQN